MQASPYCLGLATAECHIDPTVSVQSSVVESPPLFCHLAPTSTIADCDLLRSYRPFARSHHEMDVVDNAAARVTYTPVGPVLEMVTANVAYSL